ncbi:MAG: caspase family protein [Pseudomonadota bacterium]
MNRLFHIFILLSVLIISTLFLSIEIINASEPPKDPILRIDTGMHNSGIRRIGIDAENRYLATGSSDKTVRVWELSTGRLLRVIRPPIGDGNEGMIFALSMSPDGRTIACGGWTGQEWDNLYASIYIFDRESGRLIKRINGVSATILNIAYSKDGKYIIASLWGTNGIRIYSTSDYSLVKEDKDYGSDGHGADFDTSGRLVTSSWDGYVRLYDNEFRLIAKKMSPGGVKPYGVSFSPDGSKIVVGFDDSTKVDILSSNDLSYLYSPDSSGADNGNLVAVSWSSDGDSIYAGGSYWNGNLSKRPIRKWINEGKGRYVDLPATGDTILDILSLKSGGVVFSSHDPSFGIFDTYDRKAVFKSSAIADYRNNYEGFLVSYDGSAIQFAYEVFGKSPAKFSIPDRFLEVNPGSPNSILRSQILNPPVTSESDLNITDWQNNYNPKLNGRQLSLDRYEMARSLAVLPDSQSFLLGTDWYLRLFDKYGNQLWRVAAPATSWAVNITGNGRIAVAAFGDGTIRWYRLKDGKELMALFPHNDRKRWVVWTPSGYYDASAGAEEIIGWHLNNGKENSADFFPLLKFRSTYYRPDVITKVFTTVDEGEAIRLADKESGKEKQKVVIEKMLPPVVTILDPENGSEVLSTEVTIKYSIRSPSGEPVTGIKALVDGRPVATQRSVKIVSKDIGISEITVVIPSKDSEISIIAENRFSVSEPASVSLKWRGEKKDDFIIKPKLYVLAIGVSKYDDKNLTLSYAAKDAKDFADAIQRQKNGLYRDVVVKVITDEKATKGDILDGLDWLTKETTSKDVAMVFLAGHGVNDHVGIYYFLPVNADTERLKRTGLAFSDIKTTVAYLAGKTVLFVDTCHSGNIMGTRRGVADITGVVNELSSAENGAVVFASSSGKQYSLEDPAWNNGAFTKALVEGIGGKADYTGKGKITINMLDLYLSERVKELTKGRQTPTTTKPSTISDFPIAVR